MNMEENVALDSVKQKDFLKSVNGIKRLLKKKDKKSKNVKAVTERNEPKEKAKVKKSHDRGLVYLSHIPHGFYEQQMTEYFKQFGGVTNARVIRSRRTGNSKGYAFVEFKDTEVAQVVAETMNNYLMGKRLIKAAYIPPHKQRKFALRKKWNPQNNPSREERLKFKKMHNASKPVEAELKMAKKLLFNLSKTKKKLNDLGIDYDFFEPVDVPEGLQVGLSNVADVKPRKQVKNENKDIKSEDKILEIKSEPENNGNMEKTKKKKKKNKQKLGEKLTSDFKEGSKTNLNKNDNGKVNEEKPEKEKGNKLKKTGIKPLENFISIKEADDSESSIDFDSDEFEKMMENDDDMLSGDENIESENDESELTEEVQEPKKQKKNKGKAKLLPETLKKEDKGSAPSRGLKRKNVQNSPVADKKVKFEKKKSKKSSKKSKLLIKK